MMIGKDENEAALMNTGSDKTNGYKAMANKTISDVTEMEIVDGSKQPMSPPAAYQMSTEDASSANAINPIQQAEQAAKSALNSLMELIKPSSYVQRRNYSTINISAEKWLMQYDAASMAKLESPPSLGDGISKELEKEIRYLGCQLIQEGAILARLNQTAAATAQILFQRFYYQKSFVRHNFEHMVQACLLLASKIEEEPRKPRDIINVYNRLKQIHHCTHREHEQPQKKFEHLELSSRKYQELKNTVIKAERKLLNVLGFVVHVHHPHKLVYCFLHVLGQLKSDAEQYSETEIKTSRQLLQRAWNYMNDGLRTDMFLRYTSETIACACIQLAVKTVDEPIVLPKEPFPWFELFDASDRDVCAISQMLLDLYGRTKAPNLAWISDHLDRQYQRLVVEPEKERLAKQREELKDIKEQILQRKSALEARNTPPVKEVATSRAERDKRRSLPASASLGSLVQQARRDEQSPPSRKHKRKSRSRSPSQRERSDKGGSKDKTDRRQREDRSRDNNHRVSEKHRGKASKRRSKSPSGGAGDAKRERRDRGESGRSGGYGRTK